MRVHIGGDHAAYDLLVDLVAFLEAEGHEVTNHGPHAYDAEDDYPVFVLRAAEAVAADPGSLGVVLGGSGNGEQMAANKVAGIRAALCYDDELARLAREHNDAQVISIGARMNTAERGQGRWSTSSSPPRLSGDPRHARRIDMVSAYERTAPSRRSRVLWIERAGRPGLTRLCPRIGRRPGGGVHPGAFQLLRGCLSRGSP